MFNNLKQKIMKAKIFLTGLALVVVTAFASAQNQGGKGNGTCNGTAKCAAFVDANKNGICDTYETRTANGSVGKGNGTGTCTGVGTGQGQKQGKGKGVNFIDVNQNGVCDTYEARTKK
jgi:hypothetical protein